MTTNDMEKMANYHEHMSEWCRDRSQIMDNGLVSACLLETAWQHDESARYWREQRDK